MPSNLMKNTKPFFLPIFDWDNLIKKNHIDLNIWEEWYPIINTETLNLSADSFALKSKPSMHPKFPKGSLLIINPNETAGDSDIILVHMLNTDDFSLRELIVDSPRWILKPVICGSESLFYNKEDHNIMGVLILTIFHQRD